MSLVAVSCGSPAGTSAESGSLNCEKEVTTSYTVSPDATGVVGISEAANWALDQNVPKLEARMKDDSGTSTGGNGAFQVERTGKAKTTVSFDNAEGKRELEIGLDRSGEIWFASSLRMCHAFAQDFGTANSSGASSFSDEDKPGRIYTGE